MTGTARAGGGRQADPAGLPGWERLRHGGLLLDGTRLAALSRHVPPLLDAWTERQLRQRSSAMLDESGEASPFVALVLEQVCGLDASTGAWTRGSHVAPAWGRRAVTGETVKPRHLWQGRRGGRLPVFLDDGKQLGIGKSRRAVSLLPRDNPLYHESYGLHGLLERLERAAARGGNLAGSFGAWPRVLALFALVREGSHHPDLPVTAYGGDLFAPGAVDAGDGVSRALRVYEQACFEHEALPDRDVHEMLRLLTRTTIRIRQGRSSARVVAPVDFSDLSSEYIGILYEGLLDYELKTAPAGDPVIFLAVGDQPALPLSRLEAMDEGAVRTLFERLKEKSGATEDLPEKETPEADAAETEEDIADAAPSAGASSSADAAPEHVTVAPDERQRSRTRAEEWARRAVQAARLLKKPRGRDTPERRLAFESRLAAKARQLVVRVVLPGEWYLVRWGGTRKGSGSFYTRPGLAVPTVHRTLRPLAYDPPAGADGTPDADAPPARWTPKPPERILDLTVCDPACGSGTFPLAALRFLTAALYAALQHHGRLEPDGDRVLVRLLGIRRANDQDGDESRLADELIPCRPDDEFFSNHDPLYRSYGKQDALDKQSEYFADVTVERDWLNYNAQFRARSNFASHAATAFGDPEENASSQDRFTITQGHKGLELHERWRNARLQASGFADPAHPFRHQGAADLNLYKLFLETAHALLKQPRPCADGESTGDADTRGGRLGLVVPSGLYSDHGTGALRDLFLHRCRWEWLFGVENRDRVFPIHRSYKFNPVIVEKGGATEAIRTVFMRRDPDDWERAEELAIPYTLAQVKQFSPKSRAILEIQSQRDLEILEKIYANAVLLGDDGPDGWGLRYATEFHMTNDSHLFSPRPRWEAKGYRPDEYSRWLLGEWRPIEELWEAMGVDPSRPRPMEIDLEDWLFDTTAGPERREAEARFVHGHWLKPGDVARTDWRSRCAQSPYDELPIPRAAIPKGVILSREGDAWIREERVDGAALPLYEGRMIGQCDSSQKGWVSGKGRRAVWRDISWDHKRIEPQYLMAHGNYVLGSGSERGLKLAFMDVTSSTNARTMIASPVADSPCGNKAPILVPSSHDAMRTIELSTITNTIAFDWITRQHLSGITLNWYIIESLPLPTPGACSRRLLAVMSQLLLSDIWFAGERLQVPGAALRPYSNASSPPERLRIAAMVDAVVATAFGFSVSDLRHALAECAGPLDNSHGIRPKGFWRVDRDKAPELRQTVLALVAFLDLQEKIDAAGGNRERGTQAFLDQNDGEGWMLPETLRLADYGLGHDDRAREPQPVASRLGPRFYDWQLVHSAVETWRECHLHARNLLSEDGYALRIVDLIEQRMADGEDYFGLLTDRFKRELLGDAGYVTALVEIRAREVLYERAYWAMVTDLRNAGHLDDRSHDQLLRRLHERELLDDAGTRRQGRATTAPEAGLPALRVAEPRAGYQADLFPTKKQRDLFE